MSFEVEYFTLMDGTTSDSTDYVVLRSPPVLPENVAVDIIGGTAQYYGGITPDFTVSDMTVKWDSTKYNLYGQLMAGDRIRVIYDKS